MKSLFRALWNGHFDWKLKGEHCQEPLHAPSLKKGCFPGDFPVGKRPIKAFGD